LETFHALKMLLGQSDSSYIQNCFCLWIRGTHRVLFRTKTDVEKFEESNIFFQNKWKTKLQTRHSCWQLGTPFDWISESDSTDMMDLETVPYYKQYAVCISNKLHGTIILLDREW
jgi:hypothetical protein